MALMRISILPVGTASPSIGDYIADAMRQLDDERSQYILTDMGTVVQGSPKELLALAGRLHEMPFSRGARRVFTSIDIDDRRDKKVGLQDKVDSVKQRLA